MDQLKFEMNGFLIAAIERLMDSGDMLDNVEEDFIETMDKLGAPLIQDKVIAVCAKLQTPDYKPIITGGAIATEYVKLAKEMLEEVEKNNG